jgi:chloramphenicol-sensitive protein RarD
MYVFIGVLVLREKLRALQTTAVILAAAGVAVLTVSGGEFPFISLSLAVSFTIYGVIRSRVVVGGMPGLFIETLILFPMSLAYMMWLMHAGVSYFRLDDPAMMGGLMLARPPTVVPLLSFALAARRIRLSTIGIMQFISPTLQFLVGLAYGEELTLAHAVCFALIWVAVIVFSWDAWRSTRPREPLPVTGLG